MFTNKQEKRRGFPLRFSCLNDSLEIDRISLFKDDTEYSLCSLNTIVR